jgi:acetyl esterase
MSDYLARFDPDVRRFLETMRDDWKAYPPFETLSWPEARAIIERIRSRWSEGGPKMAETSERVVETAAGPLRVRIHRPEGVGADAPVMIYTHGGGFTLFSLDTHDRLMREYAERARCVVIGTDYPLSPEIKYPVALNLITAFTIWLADNAAEVGVDPKRIMLAGDSAGGNISMSTCLKLRDAGRLDIVRCVLCNYAGFSGRVSDEAEAEFGGPDSIMDRAEAEQYWANYLNDPSELDDPFANPIHADLHGLPPVFLAMAEIDIVTESSRAFGVKLVAHGVEVTQRNYLGASHSFLEAMSISSLAVQAIDDGARFVRSHLGIAD